MYTFGIKNKHIVFVHRREEVVVESKDKNIRDDVMTSSLLLEKKINTLLMELTLIFLIQNYRE